MTLSELLERIGMSKTYAPRILEAYDEWTKEESPSEERAKELLLGNYGIYADPEKAIMLLMYVAVEERNHGAWARFPEQLFVDSMLVFTRTVDFDREATGKETYCKGPWPLIHASAKWFRLGELEFELNDENESPQVNIHIPAGAKLTPEALKATFRTERDFMRQYLPEWAERPHYCGSWMMSPVLKDLLPENSNILYFQSLFELKEFTPTYRWVLEFVFKMEEFQMKDVDFRTLPEDTSLQRSMKKYMLAGGNPGEGLAVLKPEAYI